MKIAFFDDGDMNTGSTRIWVYNLVHWLSQLGINAHINPDCPKEFDVIILGKNLSLKKIKPIIASNDKALYGNINPSDYAKRKKILKLCDFFIVGSIEEKVYYLKYSKKVFIFPLIETIYSTKKIHVEKNNIILGYHGNKMHLEEFHPHIKKAIEEVAKTIPLKMIAVYNIKKLGKWKKGRPDIDIEDIQWDIETIEKQLIRADIGIVPSNISLSPFTKTIILGAEKLFHPKFGFSNDYLLRFKNNSNAGRAFVFHQLNIPVISDLSPSNFHILADIDSGYIANGQESWTSALFDLANSANRRALVSENAYKEFKRKYDPIAWAKRLYDEILTLHKNNKRSDD